MLILREHYRIEVDTVETNHGFLCRLYSRDKGSGDYLYDGAVFIESYDEDCAIAAYYDAD